MIRVEIYLSAYPNFWVDQENGNLDLCYSIQKNLTKELSRPNAYYFFRRIFSEERKSRHFKVRTFLFTQDSGDSKCTANFIGLYLSKQFRERDRVKSWWNLCGAKIAITNE